MSELENFAQNIPPLAPDVGAETEIADDTSFVAQCMSIISPLAKIHDYHLGPSLLTSHERFGRVFRVDFKNPRLVGHMYARFQERIIFWINTDGNLAYSIDGENDLVPLGSTELST